MIKVLNHYFITLTLLLTMLILSVGFLTHFNHDVRLIASLTIIVTLLNFALETKLKNSNWSESKQHFIKTVVFPINILIIGIICLIYFQLL
ncbi:hypothetical protein DOS68_02150 [Staphylococcus felis]|uniref:Uncharacterized protein n=1 Tax=Staphylococcus felis TaxID=46127 RepID=A0AAX1RWK9_9STAP|nr:hypothetical protein [Staphylococcus felis]MBH9581083.1 hypothetical protein [Staphylococcus felis]MDM8328123.1 hypothetical protein [Staphylococcus felis]MDQ7193069.1 hypothetical protein [Staphylococcus felis]REH78671.1 hypothetical protein DOS59_04885 [Staphylococcus felis]REH84373.1 hypothetical protein DOS56_04265 [Staphylococcus felis]